MNCSKYERVVNLKDGERGETEIEMSYPVCKTFIFRIIFNISYTI